jgi:hypothetical protein
MPIPQYPNPIESFQRVLGQVEDGVNAVSTRTMDSDGFAQVLHQFLALALGTQHMFARAMDGYFRALQLPSRKDIGALSMALQRIEERLDGQSPELHPQGPKPPRTRRPSGALAAAPSLTPEPLSPETTRRRPSKANGAPTKSRSARQTGTATGGTRSTARQHP